MTYRASLRWQQHFAATIGTGNIVRCCNHAIGAGGPGACNSGCGLTGLFGMATKFGEATLAVKYRGKSKRRFLHRWSTCTLWKEVWVRSGLGVLFAILTGIACFGIGNMTQGQLYRRIA